MNERIFERKCTRLSIALWSTLWKQDVEANEGFSKLINGNFDLIPHIAIVIFVFAASRENHVIFGDCAVGVSKRLSFTLTNHSLLDPVRFTWSPPREIMFSPCTGHLQPNCAKDVTVTFCSSEPKTYSAINIPCKVTKIKLGETEDKVLTLHLNT